MPYRSPARAGYDPASRPFVFTGGASLAAVAGYVNVAVLSFFHVPVSHMTGAVSRLSSDVQSADLTDLRLILLIISAFLAGAVVSGMVIGGRRLAPGRRYGVALIIEGLVLLGATAMLRAGLTGGVPLAALACGVQNGMASSYYGLVLRTTHVTGIVTDIGVMIGHWVRHRRVRLWKLLLLTSILAGFFVGGVAGAFAVASMGAGALLLPSIGCLAAGSIYFAWRQRERRPETVAARSV